MVGMLTSSVVDMGSWHQVNKSIILTPSQQIYYPDTKSTSLLSWHQVNKSIILTPSQQVYYPDSKSTSLFLLLRLVEK
jgi:hypothetical protein